MATATIKCRCGVTCRIQTGVATRQRCAKCKHEFTPKELITAVPEEHRRQETTLDFDGDDARRCPKCKWEGDAYETEDDDDGNEACPKCGTTLPDEEDA